MKPLILPGGTDAVRAVLDGRKTQFRVAMKPQPKLVHGLYTSEDNRQFVETERLFESPRTFEMERIYSPYSVGDVCYVRETWTEKSWGDAEFLKAGMADRARTDSGIDYCGETLKAVYKADGDHEYFDWMSPVGMPRWAARLFVEITAVQAKKDDIWFWCYEFKRVEKERGG